MANWVQTKPLAGNFPTPGIQNAINTVRSVIQTLVAILGITNAILNIIKVFALGLQNPLLVILLAVKTLIENILEDLQRAGLYLHGDFYDLKWPFEELRGGFSGFEQRMVRRLTDPTDPERPIFSNASQVVALFLYLKADATAVIQIVNFVKSILELLNQEDETPAFPAVSDVEVGYGWQNLSLVNLPLTRTLSPANVSRNGIPTIANLSWSLETTGPFSGIRKFAPPIKGFLVEVSVYPEGLIPIYSSPVPSNTDDAGVQFQQFGRYLDNRKNPIVLYGGADQVDAQGVSYNDGVNNGSIAPGARVAYFVRNLADTTPIPMEMLKDGSDYLLQRTFFVRSTASRILYLNQKFTFRLRAEDLPYTADFEVQGSGKVRMVPGSKQQAKTAFVRIRPVGDRVSSETDFKYPFRPVVVSPAYAIPTLKVESEVGQPYGPFEVSFPSEEDATYFDHMRSALAVLTLTRPDIEPSSLNAFTQLQQQITGRSVSNYYTKTDTSSEFRKGLNRRIDAVMASQARYMGTLSDSYKQNVVDRTGPLVEWKWSDADPRLPETTILETLEDTDSVAGIARNLKSIYDLSSPQNQGTSAVVVDILTARNAVDIDASLSEFRESVPVIVGAGPGYDPASQLVAGYVKDARTTIPEEVVDSAAIVLRAANVPFARVPGGWIQVRLFQQAIPGVDNILRTLLNFIEELEQGLSGIIAALIDYIEFLQARVRELSELLLRIDAYLQFLLQFQIPQVNALLITDAKGTDGIVQGLLNAGNQPDNFPDEYVAGVVLVSGGLPSFVVDIIKAIAG